MTDRAAQIDAALAGTAWRGWDRAALAGDASRRRYERLFGPAGETRILMDAPPAAVGDIAPFLRIGAHLSKIGLRAPRIDHADANLGLIVMEDFGDALLATHLVARPSDETALYTGAAELLAHLQAYTPAPGLSVLDPTEGVRLVVEVAEWLPGSVSEKETVLAELDFALRRLTPQASVMALRDFHAENLVLCADGAGLLRFGLLDFQDAVLAHPAYDFASLLRDVRRDVSEAASSAAIDRFATLTGTTVPDLHAALAIQGVQRNLRILGVFHRLARRDGKSKYLGFLPHLGRLLARDLSHPELIGIERAASPLLDRVAPHDA